MALIIVGYFYARVMMVWNEPNSDSTARVQVVIPPGTNLKTIAEYLHEAELIRDPLAFEIFVRWQGLGTDLQAGEYILQRNLTMGEITELLQQAKSPEIRITIPEGYTIDQIDALLSKKSLIDPGDFTDCAATCDLPFVTTGVLEGYLFPATYYVNPESFSPTSFIRRLYNEMQTRLGNIRQNITASGRSPEDIIIVASMIEREANSADEMPLISGVIWKRLDEGIALGIDATTRYELGNWTTPLTTADLEAQTPYNTRRKLGLPPTAISNPGFEALKAAATPQESEYYYYLHDRTGQVHFSRTLQEHNEKKNMYLR